MKVYVSLPRRYDKTEVTLVRVQAKKRQKTIKAKFEKNQEENE